LKAVVANNVINGLAGGTGTGLRVESGTGAVMDCMVLGKRIDNCGTPFQGVATGTLRGRFDLFGLGTPEGVITAPIGSTWSRQDGGTSTTFYVKESGTGNTGWTAMAPGGGGGGVTAHSALTGLSSGDDHPQYVRKDRTPQ